MPLIGTSYVQDSRAFGTPSWRKVREQRARCSLKLDRVAGMAGAGEGEVCKGRLPLGFAAHAYACQGEGRRVEEGRDVASGRCMLQPDWA